MKGIVIVNLEIFLLMLKHDQSYASEKFVSILRPDSPSVESKDKYSRHMTKYVS